MEVEVAQKLPLNLSVATTYDPLEADNSYSARSFGFLSLTIVDALKGAWGRLKARKCGCNHKRGKGKKTRRLTEGSIAV